MRDYIQPKNTKRYKIIETISNGENPVYHIECYYFQKKYVFWGDVIEKHTTMDHFVSGPDGKGMNRTMYFRTLDEAQVAISKANTNSRVVKEIEVK